MTKKEMLDLMRLFFSHLRISTSALDKSMLARFTAAVYCP